MRTIPEAEVKVKQHFLFFFRQNIIHILDMALSSAGSGRASTEEPSCEREPLPHQYSVAMVGACGVGKTTLKMKFMSSKHETEGGNLNRANFILLRESIYYENTVLKPNAIMLYFIQFSGWKKISSERLLVDYIVRLHRSEREPGRSDHAGGGGKQASV